jgi:hypothetical protein
MLLLASASPASSITVRPVVCSRAILTSFGARPRLMGRVHGIAKQHHLIICKVVQHILVTGDEGGLLGDIKLARNRARPTMFHSKPVQQCETLLASRFREKALAHHHETGIQHAEPAQPKKSGFSRNRGILFVHKKKTSLPLN